MPLKHISSRGCSCGQQPPAVAPMPRNLYKTHSQPERQARLSQPHTPLLCTHPRVTGFLSGSTQEAATHTPLNLGWPAVVPNAESHTTSLQPDRRSMAVPTPSCRFASDRRPLPQRCLRRCCLSAQGRSLAPRAPSLQTVTAWVHTGCPHAWLAAQHITPVASCTDLAADRHASHHNPPGHHTFLPAYAWSHPQS